MQTPPPSDHHAYTYMEEFYGGRIMLPPSEEHLYTEQVSSEAPYLRGAAEVLFLHKHNRIMMESDE